MNAAVITIAVGTTNPAKLDGVTRAARDIFSAVQIEAVPVDIEIPAQPWGDDETARGALARAQAAMAGTDAAYGVGIESGLVEGPGGRIYVISWAAVVDRAGGRGFGGSERFALPAEFEAALWHGAELGPLLDARFGQVDLAQHQGAVGLFSDGRRDRAGVLALGVLHAFLALLEPWRPPHNVSDPFAP
jgi:inosine/xanthosine triphosphatase